jgi:hypothetical protein
MQRLLIKQAKTFFLLFLATKSLDEKMAQKRHLEKKL